MSLMADAVRADHPRHASAGFESVIGVSHFLVSVDRAVSKPIERSQFALLPRAK